MLCELLPLKQMPAPTHAVPEATPAVGRDVPAPVWLQRISLIVLVIFCFYIGGLMTLLPWWPHYWLQNGWLLSHPAIGLVLARGWVRGLVSGVGLLDVWIGISELIHYRDFRA